MVQKNSQTSSAKRAASFLCINVHPPIELRDSAHTRRPTRLHISPFFSKLKKKSLAEQTFNALKTNCLWSLIFLITSLLWVYWGFPAGAGVLAEETVRPPSGHPAAVWPDPATFPGLPTPGLAHPLPPVFPCSDRRVMVWVTVPAVFDPASDRIGFAFGPALKVVAGIADSVAAADSAARSTFVAATAIGSAGSVVGSAVGFVAIVAGSVV